MVMTKRAYASTDFVRSRRLLSSRLSQMDAATVASAAASSKSSQQKSILHVPVVRRSEQRSTVSIAGSGSVSSHSSGSRSALLRDGVGDVSSPRFTYNVAANNATGARRAPKARQHLQLGKTGRCGVGVSSAGGGRGGACRRYLGANSAASNSACEASPMFSASRAATSDDAAGRGSRMSTTSTQRLGKTVSISASQDQDRTVSSRMGLSEDAFRRSIIKLKPLPTADEMWGMHSDEPQAREAKAESGMTPHQLREHKIFNECRFVPTDPFYKKVVVAPNQDRQFFVAPKSIRAPGSRMLYDIANQNPRHHQDVNFDFTRDSITRICSNFCRPSQFRHFY